MDEKIEEMKEIIAKAISNYLEEEGIIQLHIKGRKDGTSTKIISNAFYNAGYRKESDTARELAETIKSVIWEEFDNETIRIKDLHGCINNIVRSKYGVELTEDKE